MSDYKGIAKNPKTGQFEIADFIDMSSHYEVRFNDGSSALESECKIIDHLKYKLGELVIVREDEDLTMGTIIRAFTSEDKWRYSIALTLGAGLEDSFIVEEDEILGLVP